MEKHGRKLWLTLGKEWIWDCGFPEQLLQERASLDPLQKASKQGAQGGSVNALTVAQELGVHSAGRTWYFQGEHLERNRGQRGNTVAVHREATPLRSGYIFCSLEN